MRFAVDIDGVLANFTARIAAVANTIWPGRLRENFVPRDWNYTGIFTKEEWVQVWNQIKITPRFWFDAPPLSGVEELWHYFGQPKNMKDEVFFITSRVATIGNSPLVQSAEWLSGYGLWPRRGLSVVLTVADPEYKQNLFQGLGLQFMLDDYAPTVEQLNKIDRMHAFVFDQPWNRYARDLPRVCSVTEYLEIIKDIKIKI